jgi:5-methylcytosine-specific restriction endonuclease McrBC regulatory subunit McrC
MLDDNTLEERLSEDGTLHLSEWERLSVDISNFDPLQQVISPEDGDKCKELSVYYYYGARIKASCYVGATAFDPPVPVKKGKIDTQLRQVIITPKICDREEGWADFLRMLEVAYNIKVPDLRKEKSELDRVKDLRPILALVYARAVEDLLKKRLRRNYVVRVDRLNSRVKGKLLLAPYIREQVARGQPQIAVCQYYELTPDTPLNRIVKAGLWAAKRLVAAADNPGWDRLSGELNKSLGLMGFVQDVRITRADCARVRLHAQNRYYETAFMLAQLLLFACRFEYESGSYAVAGFFLDMNDLFDAELPGGRTF